MDKKLYSRFEKVREYIWQLPKTYRKKMRVPVRVVATEGILKEIDDGAVDQAVNVSNLPGIVGASWMMPDAHWGYGFPVGGVAAFDLNTGIISPGGIGFDINCGMRSLITDLREDEVKGRIESLVNSLFEIVPTGVGVKSDIRLSEDELKDVMVKGASWAVENGLGEKEDLDKIEAGGRIDGADPEKVSKRAIKRGLSQLGTLGSGNHYLEIQKVEKIVDKDTAQKWGIKSLGQIAVMIHCGSRGFGHQIASDYLKVHEKSMETYGIRVEDKQLACAPFDSKEGKDYFSAMAAAANFAFCNRQIIAHRVREVFSSVLGKNDRELGIKQVYDVAHNIAKVEEFEVEGDDKSKSVRKLLVHRKGATRSYHGQPVIIGGSMETGSYLLVGTNHALETTFGSTAHGSGRTMSRTKAKKMVHGKSLKEKMLQRGIYVKSATYKGLAEEAALAYKDINEVVESVSGAGISHPVVYLKPLGNIKG